MTVQIYLAPVAAGKTHFVLAQAQAAVRRGLRPVRIVVPTPLQAQALRRRLAELGGALGITVLPFDEMLTELLDAAAFPYVLLEQPLAIRLIRHLLDQGVAPAYAPLRRWPGFLHLLEQRFAEFQAAAIAPAALEQAARAPEAPPHLRDLVALYRAYRDTLARHGWSDRAGRALLAVQALEQNEDLAREWAWLALDGFDDFSSAQLAVLQRLAQRVGTLLITLTGPHDGRDVVFRRFARTQRRLEETLKVRAQPLPTTAPPQAIAAPLRALQARLFTPPQPPLPTQGHIERIEAPHRAAEVRVALRWLKARLVHDGLRPRQVALLVRHLEPYRPFIQEVAGEFGLPVRLVDGLPLRHNPAIAALLDLLRMLLPDDPKSPRQPALPYRLVLSAWRSPYFDWRPVGIRPQDAQGLDAMARALRVLGGLAQWEAAFQTLAQHPTLEDDDELPPTPLPTGEAARALRETFHRFLRHLDPPLNGPKPYHEFVSWLENRIGLDPAAPKPHPRAAAPQEPACSLRMVHRIRQSAPELAERDLAALRAFKQILHQLVLAETLLNTPPVDFPTFFADLEAAVEAAFYIPEPLTPREEILVLDVAQARGLNFHAVALLGLAEGEFPMRMQEDPLLPDAVRQWLRDRYHLPLDLSTESYEATFFYEALARPTTRLLVTRPLLSDTGALWEASPFWEELARQVDAPVQRAPANAPPTPEQAASPAEALMALTDAVPPPPALAAAWAQVEHAARVLHARRNAAPSRFDGDLSALAPELNRRFGPKHLWSAGRLETYRRCPFRFFTAYLLELAPRPEPEEGLDIRQLGSLYHRILEAFYTRYPQPDLENLSQALREVALPILHRAPEEEGFRPTAWWPHTQEEMLQVLERTIRALESKRGPFRPQRLEARFGFQGPPLVLTRDEDTLRLRGIIDRVDHHDGRLRIVDYKTGGSGYTKNALKEGRLLQLPLYALAAQHALRLGQPIQALYWSITQAQEAFSLAEQDLPHAIEQAVAHAWDIVHAVRQGRFQPQPPPEGCPAYCPAAAFCWHYRPGWRG